MTTAFVWVATARTDHAPVVLNRIEWICVRTGLVQVLYSAHAPTFRSHESNWRDSVDTIAGFGQRDGEDARLDGGSAAYPRLTAERTHAGAVKVTVVLVATASTDCVTGPKVVSPPLVVTSAYHA